MTDGTIRTIDRRVAGRPERHSPLPVDPLAAFALTLSVSVAGVAYVLRMAAIETRRKGMGDNPRT